MEPLPERYTVRRFVQSLETGTRVIWIATGAKGSVQPDKSILWDDGTTMTTSQMTDSHAVLIHTEPEWLRIHDALTKMLTCIHKGCTLERWDDGCCEAETPQKLCPLAVLSDPDELPMISMPRRTASGRLGSSGVRPRLRA